MIRREFITLIGGAATWPLAARAQPVERVRRVGVFMDLAENDREGQTRVAAFRDGMKALGWIEGRNVNYDYRWTAGNPLRRTLRRAGITGYSVHGLRKNAGVALADAGCDMREIMAILGHRTFAMALHYTKRAGQKRRARTAMDKWEAAESGKPKNIAGSKR